MSITLTRQERDALYERIVIRLGGIDGVHMAVEDEDWVSAQELGQEFSDLLRLVCSDLGWGEGTEEVLTLSTPPDVLVRAAAALQDLAGSDRAHYGSESRDIQEKIEEAVDLQRICERLIGESEESADPH